MNKTLKVIKPFFVMQEGDTFVETDKNTFVSKHEEYDSFDDANTSMFSQYNSSYEISDSLANKLIEDGYLSAPTQKVDNKQFVNVFEEIEKLAMQYDKDLDDLMEENNMPACLKVEKETVLRNMLKVLEHLHSLKK